MAVSETPPKIITKESSTDHGYTAEYVISYTDDGQIKASFVAWGENETTALENLSKVIKSSSLGSEDKEEAFVEINNVGERKPSKPRRRNPRT